MRIDLKQYSLLANSIIGAGSVIQAQVSYTNIEPDIVVDTVTEYLFLDINEDGDDDFLIGMGHLSRYGPGSIGDWHIYGPSIFWTENPENAVHGLFVIGYEGTWTGRAYNLSTNYFIGSNINFIENISNAFICAREYWENFEDNFLYAGQLGFWQDIQTDRYLGIRFQDGLDRTHYGWIRCDAPDSGRVLVIKDYAYETQAGVGIIAGDMGEPVGIQTENKLLFSLYPNPAQEWIEIRHYENEQLFADIRNLEGKLLLTQALQSGSANRLPVADLPMGTYVAVIRNETGEVKGKQVWVKSR